MRFLKVNHSYETSYPFVWFGFRLCAYSFFVEKNFAEIREMLTFYNSMGESKKYNFFGKNWWKRRFQSHNYLKKSLNLSRFSFDYVITILFNFFFK